MRPITPDDLFQLNRIGDPQLSPDGTWVVYTEQHIDPQSSKWHSDLWLVPADGSAEPRRLTGGGANNHSPRWAPVGQRIAFFSDRSGKTQVWLLDLGGGEAAQVTDGEVEPLGSVSWSPDGAHIAFAAWTRFHEIDELPYPGAPAQMAGRSPEGKDRPRVITRFDHKQDGVGHYGDRYRQLYRCTVGTGPTQPERLITLEAHCHLPAWSPDGSQLAFVVVGKDDEHFFSGSNLWLMQMASGQEAQLLWRPGGTCSSTPAWSPDGLRIAIAADDGAFGAYATTTGLWEVNATTGKAENLTAAFDREVSAAISSDWRVAGTTAPTWTDEGWIFLARSTGESHIYRAPGIPLTHGAMAVDGYSYSGGRLVYQAARPNQPDYIYSGERVLARPGGIWNEVQMQPARRFQYQGAKGQPIDGWVILPDGEGPHPAALCIHGGPHNVYGESFTLQFHLLAGAGYAVVYLNPRGSQSYGQEFAGEVCGDWGGSDYEDVMLGLDAAIALGGIDPNRLAVTGWSYGGFMTNRIVTRTNRFKAAMSGACISNTHSMYGTSDIGAPFLTIQVPGLPWEEPERLLERSPLQDVALVTTPVLLLHGESDLRCPISQSEEFYLALKQLEKTAVFVRYPGEPHAFTQPLHIFDRHRRTIAWFDHYC